MMTVTIRDLSTKIKLTHSARTNDRDEAIARAVRRHYGARASYVTNDVVIDSDATFGQIIEPCASGGNNCITGLVRVDVEAE